MGEKDVNFGFEGSTAKISLDSDNDGVKSLELKLHLTEAVGEAIKKGGSIEDAKVVDLKFEGAKLIVVLDTDRDGEPLLELVADLPEGFDEAAKKL
jgi:hypothetical protein